MKYASDVCIVEGSMPEGYVEIVQGAYSTIPIRFQGEVTDRTTTYNTTDAVKWTGERNNNTQRGDVE